jgi:hypothetical protein
MQSPSLTQATQVLDVEQRAAAGDEQSPLVRHATHWFASVSHTGVEPVHFVEFAAVHSTHVFVVVSHAGVAP